MRRVPLCHNFATHADLSRVVAPGSPLAQGLARLMAEQGSALLLLHRHDTHAQSLRSWPRWLKPLCVSSASTAAGAAAGAAGGAASGPERFTLALLEAPAGPVGPVAGQQVQPKQGAAGEGGVAGEESNVGEQEVLAADEKEQVEEQAGQGEDEVVEVDEEGEQGAEEGDEGEEGGGDGGGGAHAGHSAAAEAAAAEEAALKAVLAKPRVRQGLQAWCATAKAAQSGELPLLQRLRLEAQRSFAAAGVMLHGPVSQEALERMQAAAAAGAGQAGGGGGAPGPACAARARAYVLTFLERVCTAQVR